MSIAKKVVEQKIPRSTMASALLSMLGLSATYCCTTAANSLCHACFDSQTTNGRKRSVLLLSVAIASSLYLQFGLGPQLVHGKGWFLWLPGVGSRLEHAWKDGCPEGNLETCAGHAGVERGMGIASLLFGVLAIATYYQPLLNRQAWPAKYTAYFGLLALSLFFDNGPWFDGYYLWLARLGAMVFCLLQQIILIDVAYNWNEDWVERSDQADRLEYGTGAVWLQAIVVACVVVYSATLLGIGLLYHYFSGCAENAWIISLTLLGIVGFTVLQLAGTEGSLLTSSIMALYVTYLAYSMVSKNPNPTCNPQLGSSDSMGIMIGLTLTAVSLAWIGWSWTADERLDVQGVQTARPVSQTPGSSAANNSNDVNLDVPFLDPEERPTAGLVLDQDGTTPGTSASDRSLWKLNVALMLICYFVAMTLTGWGTLVDKIDDESRAANPTAGRFNMAMIGVSQWAAIALYVWTLVAPSLFPDREFY